jgi:chromosome segregation ATPase
LTSITAKNSFSSNSSAKFINTSAFLCVMKQSPWALLTLSVAATLICLSIIVLIFQYNQDTSVEIIQSTQPTQFVQYHSQYNPTQQSVTIETEEYVAVEEETISAEDQQTMDDAEDAIQQIEEELDELNDELADIDDDIDDEEDVDDIMEDIDDVEEQAEDILYSISQWNNRLIDIDDADDLRDDLDYLTLQAEEVLDDCNDLEDDAEDLD